LARLELQRYTEALADFDTLTARGMSDAVVLIGRGVALEGLAKHGDADQVFKAGLARLKDEPAGVRIRLRWVYGFAVSTRLPDEAARAFDDVLSEQPLNSQALYGRAMLAMRNSDPEGIEFFDRALEASPSFVEARRYRAVLLARLGRFPDALRDINRCLEIQPQSGATYYAAACVASLSAAQNGDASTDLAQALAMLKHAHNLGYGIEQTATDPDLARLRSAPEYVRLVAEANVPQARTKR
jgi:tetratricopeptide (TPR) repeat protein